MVKEGYKISDIYQGGYSSLNPNSNMGITAGTLGMTTDPRSANILQEVSTKLSSGVKHIEIEAVSPEIFDSMPKQHLKEVNRLSKLTGINVSLHGPVIDVIGMTNNGFSEVDRENAERKVADVLIRSHELNPEGNIPVNFHSAEGFHGSQLLPPSERTDKSQARKLIIVDRETGRMSPAEPYIQYSPDSEKLEPEHLTPEQRLDSNNRVSWDNSISQLIFNKERADEILEKNKIPIHHLLEDLRTGKLKKEDLPSPEQEKAFRHYKDAEAYLNDLHKMISSSFSKAYEYGNEHQREILQAFSEKFKKDLPEAGRPDLFIESKAMHDLLHNLKSPQVAPKMYVAVEEFALDKSSQTYGNAAWKSYKKFKDKSPILTIENPPGGFALSTGEDIKKIVEMSREQFVKNATVDGVSESEAKKQAEKFIGATWDVGHINMLRKYGYSEKDIIKETEKVAPYLKHIHLSDNFGFEHTELPMGMGNVPLKEMMEKLGQKGFEASKIIEAGHWWNHFRTPPFQETLEAVGSPVYSMKMAPYWAQAAGLYQGYHGGMDGQWLPQINYETFGSGFSRLPAELGGQAPGAGGGRMSGRPME